MTEIRITTQIFLLITLLLPAVLFAQTATSSVSDEVETDVAEVTEPETSWYKTERVFGDINVGDFVVGPGRSEIELQPGETRVLEISVTNRISENRAFKFQIEDVTGSSDGSSALSLVEGERGPYSIRDYISFPEDTIKLALGERARVPVTISVPPDAEPGGYYGSILVSTVQLGQQGGAARNPIIARVGSHVFLTIAGEQSLSGETLGVTTVPSKWWYSEGPINFGLSYENTGSVHLNPYGVVSIKNILGDEIGYVEMEPWFVLPSSIRTREFEWNRELLFGRYTAVATINRGYDDILDEVSVSFWVFPYRMLATLFGGLFLVFFLIRVFFKTFEFKRK